MYDYVVTYFEEDGSCNQKTLSGGTMAAVVDYLQTIGIVDIDSIVRCMT